MTNTSFTHLYGNWNYPTTIRFGVGRINELPDSCFTLGMRRPLLVTDPGLATLPMIDSAQDQCRTAGLECEIFSKIKGNPNEANVNAGVEVYRSGGHDGVIAFGGGSALDAGKAIALMAGQKRSLFDFEDRADWWTRVDETAMAPVVAVPTTSGTGSEVGRASVITDEATHTKKIIFHPHMMPAIVIADPALTAALPPHLTAAVGMDALSHNLEALCSPTYHPLAQGIALEGLRMIHRWLEPACKNGTDLEARAHMQVASTMGATAFQKGLGAMHALSHPCGSVLDIHHGLCNAVVMPYVLEFNRSVISDKLTLLARYLALPNEGFNGVLEWILGLRERIGIAHTIADLGVGMQHVSELSLMAEHDPSAATNPIKLTSANCAQLYTRCIEGQLD
jgi:alcohol dehydrogenase class IV